jgi:hypothetical protein
MTKLKPVKVWSEQGKFLGNIFLSKSEIKHFSHKIVKAGIALDWMQIKELKIDESDYITLEENK